MNCQNSVFFFVISVQRVHRHAHDCIVPLKGLMRCLAAHSEDIVRAILFTNCYLAIYPGILCCSIFGAIAYKHAL